MLRGMFCDVGWGWGWGPALRCVVWCGVVWCGVVCRRVVLWWSVVWGRDVLERLTAIGGGGGGGRNALELGVHSPFQVLDASAIEGTRGLAGESSSIYNRIQIYKALTPPAPPSVSRRDGRTWASVLCGIL